MTASAGTPSRAAAIPAIPLHRRLYGFGSIYGKTIRDSRVAFIIAAGMLGGMALVMGAAVSSIFPTPQARLEVDKLVGSLPASMVNLFGNATAMGGKLGTLGGYMTFKYGAIFAMGTALWSIFALSSTLAGEARSGSLDMVAAAPFGKRRIALEKVAAHLTMLALAMVILAVGTTVSSLVFGDAALGDTISPVSSVGFALWTGFIALFFGGLAFALSPLLGRAGSAAVASLSMAVLWMTSGLDVGGPLVAISPFHWTASHIPLVGMYDWPPLALVGVIGVLLLASGSSCSAGATSGSPSASPCRACPLRSWAPAVPSTGPSASSSRAQRRGASGWASSARSTLRSSGPCRASSRPAPACRPPSRRCSRGSTSRRPAAGCSCMPSCCTSRPASLRRRSWGGGHRTRPTGAWRRS